ncbi:U3 small nucleolar RNA-associated protein [Spiromyces aspiralis]|uniref:U3 small nucleolar RNA-associated protein n=1 Tax=Spiromyces aspiralis TaxID=68401 RepID=A0ACC1HP37_9FUNG|nr:U3 small nucleolar RNA-associated protein [Spiromyces aspiralis]
MTTGDGKLTLKSCYDDVGSIESIYTGGRVVQSHDEKLLCTACNEDIVVIETATGKKLAQLEGVGY